MGDENKLQKFFNENFGEVRALKIGDDILFLANDVAKILEYSSPKDAISRHCKGATFYRYLTEGGEQETKFIKESDVMRLIVKSKMDKAEEIEQWIFEVVLPAIRKDGTYISGEENLSKGEISEEEFILKAMTMMQNKIDRLKKENEEMKPKAEYHDNVLNPSTYKKLVTMTEIAKDLQMSAQALNKKLHDNKIIYKVNGSWVLYADYQHLYPDYFDYHVTEHGQTLKATEKGRKFIIDNIINKKENIEC